MWTTFWPDLIVAGAGALLTVVIAAGGFWLQRRRTARRAVSDVIRDYEWRQALDVRARTMPSKKAWKEKHRRVMLSVFAFRDGVTAARANIGPNSKHQETFLEIVDACNQFIRRGEDNRHAFRSEQFTLTTTLATLIAKLPKVTAD